MAKSAVPIMMYLGDVDILDAEAESRAKAAYGAEFRIFDYENRKELIRLRKEILHEIVGASKVRDEK